MQLDQISRLRHLQLRSRQRQLFRGVLLSSKGWVPITDDGEAARSSANYAAARRLQLLGLLQIERRVVNGRARNGVALTDLGLSFAKQFTKSIVFGGPIHTWRFRRRMRQALETVTGG